MANINGVEKNAALIKQVQDKIDTILLTSEKMDVDLVTVIEGKKVLTDEVEKFKKLKEVIEILDFKDKEESTLFAFEDIYLEKSKQERLFELANDKELDLSFPNAFGQYGEIPNHPGLKCPRPKSLLETTESYEDYLKEYYSRHKIEPQFNEDGLRSEYPHERFEWSKGTASQPASPDYVHPNYKAYKEWKAEEAKKGATTGDDDAEKGKGSNTGGGTGTGNGTGSDDTEKGKGKGTEGGDTSDETKTDGDGPDLDGDATDRKKKSEERTKKRKGLFGLFKKDPNRRVYVKDKKTLKDYLLAPFRKISEADGTLANGQNWPKIKRLLVGAAIVVGGAALIATVGGPLISTVATGILNWPMMLTGALTGTMTTSGGAMVTLTVLDRIVMGLVGAAVPAGIIGSIYHIIKKRKGKAIDDGDDKGPKGPQDGDDGDEKGKGKGKGKGDDKGHDKGKGKGKGDGDGDGSGDDDDEKGKGGNGTGGTGDENDEPVIVEGTSFEERVAFIATKLHEINNELNEIAMQEEAFKGQTSSLAAEQAKILETRRKKLELMKSKYQIELMKLTGNTYEQSSTMGEEDLSAGGMKK